MWQLNYIFSHVFSSVLILHKTRFKRMLLFLANRVSLACNNVVFCHYHY